MSKDKFIGFRLQEKDFEFLRRKAAYQKTTISKILRKLHEIG